MIEIGVMAILNQEPGKIENVFSDISTSIERSISDFDRSHSGSLSKKQASEALSKNVLRYVTCRGSLQKVHYIH